jgi:predicted RNase H-like nuclease (RuvC/YqgF family)
MREAERQVDRLKEDNWNLQTMIKEKEKMIEDLEFKVNEMMSIDKRHILGTGQSDKAQRINTPGFGESELLK